MLYQNVRGLNTKLKNTYLKSFESDLKILVFTETWLKPDIRDTEILSDQYQLFRNDRLNKVGGGVLIAVHNSISSERVMLTDSQDVEFVCAKLSYINQTIYITCSYIPPNSDSNIYLKHSELIKNISHIHSPNSELICLGDFNLPNTSWILDDDTAHYVPVSSTVRSNDMENFWQNIFDQGLYQLNNIYNFKGKILDLVFSSSVNTSLSKCSPFVEPEDKYHPTLVIDLELNIQTNYAKPQTKPHKLNFSKTNINLLRSILSNSSWSHEGDIELQISNFYSVLKNALTISVPLLKFYSDSGPVWFTPHLRRLRNIKSRLFKKFKECNTTLNYTKYSQARSKYNIENLKSYSIYLRKMKNNFQKSPKSFYKFVNSKRKVRQFPSSMKLGCRESGDHLEIANLFADFFQNTYSKPSSNHNDNYAYNISRLNYFPQIILSEEEFLNGLLSLKSSNSPGPDGVPAYILKSCAYELYLPLTTIFNYSLTSGYFPQVWRSSFIIPLHKADNRSVVENYRGIAKLSAIPKLFEFLVSRRLTHFVSSIISPYQHGFVKGRSTVTNLLELICYVHRGFSIKCQTDIIYILISVRLLTKWITHYYYINLTKWVSQHYFYHGYHLICKGVHREFLSIMFFLNR